MRWEPTLATRNKKFADRTQLSIKVERSEVALIRREAAKRGVSMRDLVYGWIEPEIRKLPSTGQ